MSVAVLPSDQDRGVGRSLAKAFLNEAMKRGMHLIDLTTDKLIDDNLNAMYLSDGYCQSLSFEAVESRDMNEYGINLLDKDFNDSPF